jgi:hypothetical protein
MAYPITTTSGVTLASVPNGTVNNTTTSLTLIGKNYAGYGNFLNENFLYLLENFSNSIAPANALTGQLWYDSGTLVLKVYDGIQWKPIASSASSMTAPPSPVIGDLWWDTNNAQLKVYNGQGWTTIGPTFTAGSGTTGPVVDSILDSVGNNHFVLKFFIANEVIGIMSKDPVFTPQTSIAGFSTINPGFNLISPSALSGSQFTGDASNALGLNGIVSTPYLRNDQNTTTIYSITAGGGLTVGSDLIFDTSSPIAANVSLTQNNKNLDFYVNAGGVSTKAIGINGATAAVSFAGAISVNSATTAIINNSENGIGNIGASAQRFNTVFARATSAQYADLAENYLGDANYEVGTVVVFGGEKEITTTQLIADTAVAGVISTNPAYLMNSSLENGQPVALRGRVPVKVTGTVKKGDLLVTSDIAGTAVSVGRDNSHGHAVFAKSLEDKSTNEVQLIEAVII